MTPRLSIVIHLNGDEAAAWSSIQSLRLGNNLAGAEIIVLDETPDERRSAPLVAKITRAAAPAGPAIRYVAEPEASRCKAFELAAADLVLSIKPFAQLAPHAVDELLAWYAARPGTPDAVTAPLLTDAHDALLVDRSTQWIAEHWGKPLAPRPRGFGRALVAIGAGVALACPKKAWPEKTGQHFHGLDGDEVYTAEILRRAGSQLVALEAFRAAWVAPPTPSRRDAGPARFNRIRNYALAHKLLGLPTDAMKNHFATRPGSAFPMLEQLIADPENTTAATLRRDLEETIGPGSSLAAILASIGVTMPDSCDCRKRMRQMNAWGVEGCKANHETIVGWMRDGQTRWGWTATLAAACAAVKTGLAFRLDPLDPFPGLVDEAISRAEAEAEQKR